MPFRIGDGETFFLYLNVEGRTLRLSTGTRLLSRAREIERAIKSLGPRGTHDRAILAALASKRLTAQAVCDAVTGHTVDALRATLREVDLSPLVDEWAAAMKLRPRTAREYVATVRHLIASDVPFPASTFTKGVLQRHFDRWVTPSRNKYRSAFSRFAEWLVARELLDRNPVRETHGVSENEPRIVWYTPEQAQALVAALEEPWRSLEALLCGSGIDEGAALAATRQDVNEERRTVFAHGPPATGGKLKTRFRVRDCVVTEGWCWDIFWAHARKVMPAMRLFPHEKHAVARHHNKAVAAAHLHASWPRDWRHTFAVTHAKRNTSDWQIAAYLGHTNTLQVRTVYARFFPTSDELSYKRFQEAK